VLEIPRNVFISSVLFAQTLNAVRIMLPAHFWVIWTAITSTAAICCLALVVLHAATSATPKENKGAVGLSLIRRQVGAPGAFAAMVMLAAFLGAYVTMILVWEDFAYYDNSIFINYTLKGRNYPKPIWLEQGRFFPLGWQEFNLFRHFTNTITGYHMLSIVQLVIFSWILLILDDELSIPARVVLTILALVTPSILISFSGLIFPERNVLFFLASFVLSVRRFEQTKSIAWAVAAVVCAQIMLYYKESVFLLLFGFAAGRLFLRVRNAQNGRWDHHQLWDAESALDLCFASLAVLFSVYYFAVIGIHQKYAGDRRQPPGEIFLAYIRLDFLAWLFMSVVLGRIFLILRHRAAVSPFWDGLAFGGLLYVLAYYCLGIFNAWYLAPADFIAVLYVGRFAVLSWKKMRSWYKAVASMLVFTILIQDVSLSALAVFERKNLIQAKVELARVIQTQYWNDGGNPLKLFFPFATPYVIMEFASYLSYRGVPVEDAQAEPTELSNVALATSGVAKDGPCVEWTSLRCHTVKGPDRGDLVIVLPDDEASLAEASAYRAQGKLLFSYEPRPRIPQWLHSLVRNIVGNLRMTSPIFVHKMLSDRSMDASVTQWR
jgi:hypothetical protein